MPLPDFDDNGDLAIGVHKATLDEVIALRPRHAPAPDRNGQVAAHHEIGATY